MRYPSFPIITHITTTIAKTIVSQVIDSPKNNTENPIIKKGCKY